MKQFLLTLAVLLVTATVLQAEVRVSERRHPSGTTMLRLRLVNQPVTFANPGAGTNATASVTLHAIDGPVTLLSSWMELTANFSTAEPANGSQVQFAIGTAANTDQDLTDATDRDIVYNVTVDPFTNNVTAANSGAAAVSVLSANQTAAPVVLNMLIHESDVTGAVTGVVNGAVWIMYGRAGSR